MLQDQEPLFTHLPDEIILLIFSFLNPTNLLQVSMVNKNLHRLANDDDLWKKIAKRDEYYVYDAENLSRMLRKRSFFKPKNTRVQTRSKMKIIIKKFQSQEVWVELNIDDPSKLTVGQFAKLFFEQLGRKHAFSIEPTQYIKRNNIIPEDFQFFSHGKKFSSAKDRVFGFNNSNNALSRYIPRDQQECHVHVILSVYGKNNYCLNRHVRHTPLSLTNICLFKIKNMIEEGSATKGSTKNDLPNELFRPI